MAAVDDRLCRSRQEKYFWRDFHCIGEVGLPKRKKRRHLSLGSRIIASGLLGMELKE